MSQYFKEHDKTKNGTFSGSSAQVVDLNAYNDGDETPTVQNFNNTSKMERSNKWYFEIGYQQSFSISLFALTFVFACIMPLALPIGTLLFSLKYLIDKYNVIFGYKIEYEANAYIRKRVWTFSILAVGCFQLIMVVCFLATKDDDVIILSFLLLIFSIFTVYYFIATEAWKGKIKKQPERKFETFDEEEKTDSFHDSNMSLDMKMTSKVRYIFVTKINDNLGTKYTKEKRIKVWF